MIVPHYVCDKCDKEIVASYSILPISDTEAVTVKLVGKTMGFADKVQRDEYHFCLSCEVMLVEQHLAAKKKLVQQGAS